MLTNKNDIEDIFGIYFLLRYVPNYQNGLKPLKENLR